MRDEEKDTRNGYGDRDKIRAKREWETNRIYSVCSSETCFGIKF